MAEKQHASASNVFRGWDAKKSIISPVIANLATALLIFVCALLLRDQVYGLFKPKPQFEAFPLYCVLDARNDEDGKVIAELFIVNLRGDAYSETELERIARELREENRPAATSWIGITAKRGREAILSVEPDLQFNGAKGRASAEPESSSDGREWRVRVHEIAGKAILKFVIVTGEERIVTGHTAAASLPFELKYAGE